MISYGDFTFHGSFMESGGKILIQLTDAEIVSRKVLNGRPKGVKRGQGQSGPFLSLQAKQAVRLQYVLLLPLAEGFTKCNLPISNVPSICHECPECMDLHN